MKLLYFISFLFFLCIRGQNYTTQSYTMDNGLPQNSIKDIVKDKYGFMWLSMEGRILRYDGSSFVEYKDFKFKNLSFGDFCGNINKDSIVVFNASEKNALLISRRKPAAITSGKIMTPGGSENNKVYKQIFKNNITIRYVPYIDTYFIQLDTGSYYFENNRIVYVDQKSHRKTKIDLEFPHSQLKRLFLHGEHLFIADAKTKKLLHHKTLPRKYPYQYSYIPKGK